MQGYVALRADGIRVEVVQCYAGQWNVFLIAHDRVVARSVEEYRLCANGYVSFQTALKIAKTLVDIPV